MKIKKFEVFMTGAQLRNFTFVRLTTDAGACWLGRRNTRLEGDHIPRVDPGLRPTVRDPA